MKAFHTSLLREKFTIHDPGAPAEKSVIALSNRVVVELRDKTDELQETFVIRAQNMHSCIRMTARIVQSYMQAGPILLRGKPFDWDAAWDGIVNNYEQTYNPQRWLVVYNRGKPIFKSGEIHPLLDLLEMCVESNKGPYEAAIPMAEETFKKTGKVVKIEYDGNVALVVNYTKDEAKNGVILRGPDKTTTFSFTTTPKDDKPLNFSQCLTAAAAFLEGMQMAFMVGMNGIKIQMGLIDRHSDEEKQTKEARTRLSRLSAEIANLEAGYNVRYRPERPEFQHVVIDAEKIAFKVLKEKEAQKDKEASKDAPPEEKKD